MLSYVVPAFNEVNNIEPTIETLNAISVECGLGDFEIIVIDDGSTDGTAQKIVALTQRFPNVVSVKHDRNQGVGMAIRSGIAVVRFPQFLIVPGDNDVPHELVRLMLSVRTRADLILSAPLNKEIRPLWRNAASMFYQLFYMVVFRTFVSYINGPGVWPTERMRQVTLRAPGFSIIAELNIKMLRSGCTFAEVPAYFRHGPKTRSTITLRNFMEVARSFVALAYEVHVRSRQQFASRPRRISINFAAAEGVVTTSRDDARP